VEPFVTHRGRVVVLDWSDVNTDLIIPARYLKRIERTGYGPLLFADKRYGPGGAPAPDQPGAHGPEDPDFPLNAPPARGATVLVVGRNFGCGSSREHAVWAVAQAGFRAVIAPGKGEGFADIFEGNALNNGLLPIELPEPSWRAIADAGKSPEGAEVTIDLQGLTVTLHPAQGPEASFPFDVPESDRNRLLKGLDAIAETLLEEEAIRRAERHAPAWATPLRA
jgi:3-isopropylmalate/(R)-2-methylmalate dehydratase small subunit